MNNSIRPVWRLALAAIALSAAANGQSVTQYRYDALGRLVAVEDGAGATARYDLDRAGNRARVSAAAQLAQSWPMSDAYIGHNLGRADTDGWSARVDDPLGLMVFGPYTTTVSAGPHVAAYRMLIDDNVADDAAVVDLDVFDPNTGTQLATRRLTRRQWKAAGAYQVFELPFDLEPLRVGHYLEFRVTFLKSAYVRVMRVGYR